MKKYLIILFTLFMFVSEVNAEACDYKDIKRLKEIAEGVEITYEVRGKEPAEYGFFFDRYNINISGITDEILVYNETDDVAYYVNTDFSTFILDSGYKKIQINSINCAKNLKTMNILLPIYNGFASSEECNNKKYKGLDICQEWGDKFISYDYFNDVLKSIENEEEASSDFLDLLDANLLFFVFPLLLLIVAIIVIVIKKRKEVLE